MSKYHFDEKPTFTEEMLMQDKNLPQKWQRGQKTQFDYLDISNKLKNGLGKQFQE